MKAIVVDDELYMLENLEEAVSASHDIDKVERFSTCSTALNYVTENDVDVAFLDINMRGIGGLGLAEKIIELQPECRIIFCTGYEEYAVSAFQLHVSGYLIKPITKEAVQKEIDHIKGVKAIGARLSVKCFGNFEVIYNDALLTFSRKKTKELFAILIDRNGSGMTARQLCAILFPNDNNDKKNATYLRQLILDLKNTLKNVDAEDVLKHETPYYRVDTKLVNCDYYSYLETGRPDFHGEYMAQYSWAESTSALLQFKK